MWWLRFNARCWCGECLHQLYLYRLEVMSFHASSNLKLVSKLVYIPHILFYFLFSWLKVYNRFFTSNVFAAFATEGEGA